MPIVGLHPAGYLEFCSVCVCVRKSLYEQKRNVLVHVSLSYCFSCISPWMLYKVLKRAMLNSCLHCTIVETGMETWDLG